MLDFQRIANTAASEIEERLKGSDEAKSRPFTITGLATTQPRCIVFSFSLTAPEFPFPIYGTTRVCRSVSQAPSSRFLMGKLPPVDVHRAYEVATEEIQTLLNSYAPQPRDGFQEAVEAFYLGDTKEGNQFLRLSQDLRGILVPAIVESSSPTCVQQQTMNLTTIGQQPLPTHDDHWILDDDKNVIPVTIGRYREWKDSLGFEKAFRVGRTKIKDFTISTVFLGVSSCEEGEVQMFFETAIDPGDGWEPVQCYPTHAMAVNGHREWVSLVESGEYLQE